MVSGIILNIQRYSTHDGPGIRTTVFLKGCPLHCLWCHNPESQSFRAQQMTDFSHCVQCGACKPVCRSGGPYPAGHPDCASCGACSQACPSEARALAGCSMGSDELLTAIVGDRIFFDQSDGGVTFSGGEPLSQSEFSGEMLKLCRDNGIHTAIETCGFAPQKTVLDVCTHADLVLFDLKGMDDARHRENTGVSVEPILDNLLALDKSGARIWLRIPLIPGYNDDQEELERMAEFAAGLKQVERIYVLPYHRMGEGKLAKLGLESKTPTIETPGPQELERASKPFRKLGLNVYIGG